MTQTHGQRLLRAAFQAKLREKEQEHAQKTTDMLNIQKQVFEDELDLIELETKQALDDLQQSLDVERCEKIEMELRFEREKEEAVESTDVTMQLVQRKLSQLHARTTRLEREKRVLEAKLEEKHVMIEVLASATAAKEEERRRTDVLVRGIERERLRKNNLIDSLQAELADLRKRNNQMNNEMTQLQGSTVASVNTFEQHLQDCKQDSKRDIDRMGRLFASVLHEFPVACKVDMPTPD